MLVYTVKLEDQFDISGVPCFKIRSKKFGELKIYRELSNERKIELIEVAKLCKISYQCDKETLVKRLNAIMVFEQIPKYDEIKIKGEKMLFKYY